jgi:chromatin remodeling complex protein RSC6
MNAHENIYMQFETVYSHFAEIKNKMTELQSEIKHLEKNLKKTFKNSEKKTKITKKRQPSGFAKPTKVTKELCDFMNKPEGSEIARTEVTKVLVQYIKDNKLQEQEKTKNKIIPDKKLSLLLGLNDTEENELTFFNIQKYMNKHFKPNLHLSLEENT